VIDQPSTWIWLTLLGSVTGAISGVLGIGGGLLMVPALTLLGVSLVQATATSLVGVFLSALSGSVQNWRRGMLNLPEVLALALFGIPMAQLGAWLGDRLPESWLAVCFALLMVCAIYFLNLKQKLQQQTTGTEVTLHPWNWRPVAQIGLLAGVLSGLFGVGGGVVMVPLQMLLLGESIKAAVRTSLGAIAPIAASGLLQHAWNQNVLWGAGLCLGVGGMLGAQFGTRLLPRLPDRVVNLLFRCLLFGLAGYMIWRGIHPQ